MEPKAELLCSLGISCPVVFDNGDTITIVGKRVTEADYPELAGRIGPDEAAVEVTLELLQGIDWGEREK